MKAGLIGALLALGPAGALATAALATIDADAQTSAGLKIAVSLAGYSSDFSSSYFAL